MSFNQVWLFLIVWAALAYAELKKPLHHSKINKRFRFKQNLLLGLWDMICFYLVLGLPFWLWATWVDYHGWGLFPLLPLPSFIKTILTIILFDLAFYGFHRLLHAWPMLWKFHQVHHNDMDVDVSTTLRFHPLEILAFGFLRLTLITLLGASRDAVVIYDLIYMLMLLWVHANLEIPSKWDRNLKRWLVTPSFHQWHHAHAPKSHNGNFSFVFSVWDRWFKTASKASRQITFGLAHFSKPNKLRFDYLLKLPFRD